MKLAGDDLRLVICNASVHSTSIAVSCPNIIVSDVTHLSDGGCLFICLSLTSTRPNAVAVAFSRNGGGGSIPCRLGTHRVANRRRVKFAGGSILCVLVPSHFTSKSATGGSLPNLTPCAAGHSRPSLHRNNSVTNVLRRLSCFASLNIATL